MKIENVQIGERHRKDIGNVDSLAASIREIGLLHPIVVNEHGVLIAGLRRLEAYKLLGLAEIPATVVRLDDIVRGEHDENVYRKDFTVTEKVAIGTVIEERERQAAKERQLAGVRPPENFTEGGEALQRVASVVGMSRPTYVKAKAVVEAAEREPELFAPILEHMDESGRVDWAYRQVVKLQAAKAPAWPSGKYRVIYADPPWQYSNTMAPEFVEQADHYPTMTPAEISALPVEALAEDNAVLFLWATSPILREALDVMRVWGFCVGVGTRILTNDLRWLPAEQLSVGARLLTFDEQPRGNRRYYKWGTVLSTGIASLPSYRIILADGTELVCSEEHAWLMRTAISGRESVMRWIPTNKLLHLLSYHTRKQPLALARLLATHEPDRTYEAGFLSAAFDSEGSICIRKPKLTFSQRPNALLLAVENALRLKAFDLRRYEYACRATAQTAFNGGYDELFRFLMQFRPPRLLENWCASEALPSIYNRQSVPIVAVEPVGKKDVVTLMTDTGTYIAEGFGAHNTYKASFVWDKVKHVMGHYNSVRHEFLLIGVRGSCMPDVRKLFDSVVTEERTEHSRKPEVFRTMIETLYTFGNRIELFARERHEGWDAYGNELP